MRTVSQLATSDLAILAASLAVECAKRAEKGPSNARLSLEVAACGALRVKSIIEQAVREILEADGEVPS